ncbi:MAG: NUDIX hydrolase [Planctomycetes bacterium]|nr:NUDIX hydrolase [Planctomycetota bacterium]
MPDKPEHVIGSRMLEAGRFLTFKELEWVDATGTTKHWESVERVDDRGAVLIIPHFVPSERLLLIRQFRPPARGYVYEFPAGLIDSGETPGEAAVRELKEETGYTASQIVVWPAAFTTPGMSNESVHVVEAEIEEEAEENLNPQTRFSGSERIESLQVDPALLGDFYFGALERGAMFDAKLATYILATRGRWQG